MTAEQMLQRQFINLDKLPRYFLLL